MSDASFRPRRGTRAYRRTAGALALSALAIGAVTAGTTTANGTPAATAAATTSAQHNSALQRELRRDVAAYLKKYGVEEYTSAIGLSVSVPGRRSNIEVTAGTMSFDSRRPVPRDAVWQIGSNTKAFTAVILLQLEAEHRLSIDDTLGKWLPQYPQWSHVTLRSLLNMTSGIPSYESSPAFFAGFVADPHRVFTKEQLVTYAASGEPTEHPWSYSNTGYILTEMIIEKVTGTSYSHQLYSRIINRLRLQDTFYRIHEYPRSVTAREPAAYFHMKGAVDAFYGKDVSGYTMSWTRGAGGIFATLADMTVWERALYSGHMLPKKQQAELTSLVSIPGGEPVESSSDKVPNAFGLGVQQSTGQPFGTFWTYEGGTLGVRTLHLYLPESGVIMAIGLNSNPGEQKGDDHALELASDVYSTLKSYRVIK